MGKKTGEKELLELFCSAIHLADNAEPLPAGYTVMEDCFMISAEDLADLSKRLQDIRKVKAGGESHAEN